MNTSVAEEQDACPFQPGAGQMPPFLAGREEQQRRLQDAAANLLQKTHARGAPAPVLLTGPRGNGKTCLLLWFEQALRTSWKRFGMRRPLHVVRVSAGKLQGDAAAEEMKGPSIATQLKESAGFIRALAPKATPAPFPTVRLHKTMRSLSRGGKAYVLLVDEAHRLDRNVGAALLDSWQELAPSHRVMVVMAGTPDLVDNINRMGATYASRSAKVLVGRLTDDRARSALRRPLKQSGIDLSEKQTDGVLSECQGYPFFIQVWGKCIWQEARRIGVRCLSPEGFGCAMDNGIQEKEQYYDDRRNELYDMALEGPARAVADLYAGNPNRVVVEAELVQAVRSAVGESASSRKVKHTLTKLKHCGLVWPSTAIASKSASFKVQHEPRAWEAEIPSLMANIRANIPRRNAKVNPTNPLWQELELPK